MKRYIKASGWGKFDILANYVGSTCWVLLCVKAPETRYGSKKIWYQLISDQGDYYKAYEADAIQNRNQKKLVDLSKSDIKYIVNDCPDCLDGLLG